MALTQIIITEATLVADPEIRYTHNGTAVASFRVASNSRRKKLYEWREKKMKERERALAQDTP